MIKTIKLKFGKSPSTAAESIITTPITIFVGPNNSGRGKVLSEIHEFCVRGSIESRDVILEDIEFENFTAQHAEEEVRRITLNFIPNQAPRPGDVIQVGNYNTSTTSIMSISRGALISTLQNAAADKRLFCSNLLRFSRLNLGGQERIQLVNDQTGASLHRPNGVAAILFTNDFKRKEVRRIIHDAFGSYLVIDPTNLGQLGFRLSSQEPPNERVERGLDDEAIQFFAATSPIGAQSDGVKAFTGIITAIIASDPLVITIDEPEAFLHPSLSFSLGKEIGRVTVGSQKRVFVATHSADFVMGCIQSGAPLNIIRLTFQEGEATARILPSQEILKLMRNPLLRSTGVLNGLFYKFVIVTEADADRALYQEINERLQSFKPEWGIPNCLFLHAQNRQTVPTIIRPLREMGIPAAGIVDIDVLKEGGSVWSDFLGSGFIPEIERQSLGQMRGQIKQKFDDSGKDMNRDGGVAILLANDKEAANNLFDRLENYGLFVVRRGEMESWLPELGAQGHGPEWLINVFDKIGEDPNTQSYIRPSADDVWRFLSDVKRWLTNPDRKGIPM